LKKFIFGWVLLALAAVASAVYFIYTTNLNVKISASPSPEIASEQKEEKEDPEVATVSETLVAGDNYIVVSDFSPGKVVNIKKVKLSQPGYVVIHQEEVGAAGEVLGSSDLLSEGETENLSVDLSREISQGEVIYAMLHSDDGDGEFNIENDVPVEDDEGNVIMMMFVVKEGGGEVDEE
jgi:glucose/arabinose dehydrogenase